MDLYPDEPIYSERDRDSHITDSKEYGVPDTAGLLLPAPDGRKYIDIILEWFDKYEDLLCLCAGTGAGKSVIFPPALYHKIYDKQWRNIVVCEPTRMNVNNCMTIIPKIDNKMHMGRNLGCQTSEIKTKKAKGLIYMTTGILIQQFTSCSDTELLQKYAVIIIDEIHLRGIEIDTILMYIKGLMIRNQRNNMKPKLVIMSATFDPSIYIEYFKDCAKSSIINVPPVSSYPIDDIFLNSPSIDICNDIVNILRNELSNTLIPYGSILIIVSGIAMGNSIIDAINKSGIIPEPTQDIPAISLIYVDSLALSKIDIRRKVENTDRKILVSTNVLETGVSIPNLTTIIDTCYINRVEYNPIYNASIVLSQPATQNSITQRRGRVGRILPGRAYRLATREDIAKMDIEKIPDIVTADFSSDLLKIMFFYAIRNIKIVPGTNILNIPSTVFDPKVIDMITTVPADSMHAAIEKLLYCGFYNGFGISRLGILANMIYGMRPECMRMILSGFYWHGNIPILIGIAACIESNIRFGRNANINPNYDNFEIFIEFLLYLRDNENINYTKFAAEYDIDIDNVYEFIALRDEYLTSIASAGLVYKFDTEINMPIIRQCAYEGFRASLCILQDDNTYFQARGCIKMHHASKIHSNVARRGDKYIINTGTVIRLSNSGDKCITYLGNICVIPNNIIDITI